MTQTELAEKAGVNLSSLNLRLKGRRGMSRETAIKLSQVTDISVMDWMQASPAYLNMRVKRAGVGTPK